MKKITLLVPAMVLAASFASAQNMSVGVTGPGATYQTVTSSINEVSLDKAMSLFPNPASGYLNIKIDQDFDFNGAELSILDIQGRVVYTEKNVSFKDQSLKISTKNLSPGVYTLNLKAQGKDVVAHKKFAVEATK